MYISDVFFIFKKNKQIDDNLAKIDVQKCDNFQERNRRGGPGKTCNKVISGVSVYFKKRKKTSEIYICYNFRLWIVAS